ncbi:MAG: hypothetical protein RR565_03805 [Erysipelothrix sp.]
MKKQLYIKLILLIIVGLTLFPLNKLFLRKSLSEPFNNQARINSLYDLPKNSVDIVFVGSSHAYTSINPNTIYRNTKIKSFVMASQQQSLQMSYYHIEETLRVQNPKVIVLNTYMLNRDYEYNEAIARDAIEYMKPSFNKLDMIFNVVPNSDTPSFVLPFLKYHSRWDSLEKIDYNLVWNTPSSSTLGFVPLDQSKTQTPVKNTLPTATSYNEVIEAKDLYYINKIKTLLDKNGVQLIMYNAPYEIDDKSSISTNALELYAKENNLKFVDYSKTPELFNFDYEVDYYDAGHLNKFGAEKFTKVFTKEIEIMLGNSVDFNKQGHEYFDTTLQEYEQTYEALE